ncbi:M20 family metallo-hydrolase [Nonomuraea indica]|uniref:M20 family metallo-hydrolase n=1 Tax=Nonomuraea indica TaxID=1581193 RepID=UPI000C7D11FB|nr:M20 family metallo-hydrolase [Nonomuraea indica]
MPATTEANPGPAIDGARLLGRLRRLAEIGADERGGVTRLGFSPEDLRGRDYVAEEAARAGLSARVDAAGNLIVRGPRRGGRPVLMMGSHLDTVRHGGPLDGAYGVLAGLEVLQQLAPRETAMEPVLVAFANEEGARFPCPFYGSLAVTGRLDRGADEIADERGVTLREALRACGGDPEALESARWRPGSIAAYLELHIEQGPHLETTGTTIGVVGGIVGRTVLDIEVRGQAGHAGTTPMKARADALAAAARVVLEVERLAGDDGRCAVATVGRLSVEPGVTNVIPGLVRMTAELRDGDRERLRAAEEELARRLAAVEGSGVRVTAEVSDRIAPVPTDPVLCSVIAAEAGELGYSHCPIFSGAGHDAQIVAAVAPIGMIFVPSRNGVSHVPEEFTADAELVAGARVLLAAAWRCARTAAPAWGRIR